MRRTILGIALMIALLSGGVTAQADYNDCQRAWDAGRHSKAPKLAADWKPEEVLSAKTVSATCKSAGPPPPKEIREAQEFLAILGYEPDPPNGQWGERTAQAYQAFVRDANLPMTDTLTPAALKVMRARALQVTVDADNAKGMLALGRLYRQGLGAPQDYVKAHLWFNLAASRGEKEALTERDALAEKMSPEQVAEAQKLAEDKPTTKSFSECVKRLSLSFVGFIVCTGEALAPDSPEYLRIAGGITEGIYTFSENTTTDADAGVSLVASMGFIFGESKSSPPSKLRSEIEVSYSLNPLNKTTETNSPGTTTDRATDGTLRQISAMLAIIYEIKPDCPITPYLKAGVGPTFLTMSGVKVENRLVFKQQTKTFFAYQFGAGLKYSINKRLAIDVGYRHIDTMTDVTLQTGSNRATVGIGNHTGLIGVTYGF